MKRKFVLCLVVVLYLLVVLLVGLALSGHNSRGYKVLASDNLVEIMGKQITVSELAADNLPQYFIRSETSSPPLLWIWYEAIPTETRVDIVYYLVWEGEINPNPFIDRFYWIFRTVYYGYPVRDIEYIQVGISRSDGSIDRIRFETSLTSDYYAVFSKHTIVQLDRLSGNTFRELLTDNKGSLLNSTQEIEVALLPNGCLPMGVSTWNHLSTLLTPGNANYSIKLSAPLKYLTEFDYKYYKFVRKSQSDYHTAENHIETSLTILAAFILIGLPGFVISVIHRRRVESQ